jgi:hypothetical protein
MRVRVTLRVSTERRRVRLWLEWKSKNLCEKISNVTRVRPVSLETYT